MRERDFINLMRLLPKSALSTAVGHLTRAKAPAALHRFAIRRFVQRYRVDIQEAGAELDQYRTFAEFFTRELKPGSRPIAPGEDVVVSPVDGVVSQLGMAEDGQCLQAKGISYSVEKLLGGTENASRFIGGPFATFYLAPRDYHRIHSPLAGEVEGYAYLPGKFWPVNPASVNSIQALFCLNERLISFLRSPAGACAVVKVGATCVARIRASYDPTVITHLGESARFHYYAQPISVDKGGELGVFEMGSTVILLFEKGRVVWDDQLAPGAILKMGQQIGRVR